MWFKPLLKNMFWVGRGTASIWRRIGGLFATAIYRATLAWVGAGTRVQMGVRFADPRIVYIGTGCYIWCGCDVSAELPGAQLVIGDRVQVNRNVHLDTTGGLTIGAGALISEGAVIYTHDHGLDPRAAPIGLSKNIAADVWVGTRAVILAQCRDIGRGAVIGAGAVVTRDVPPGAIIVGNPARVIGHRTAFVQTAA